MHEPKAAAHGDDPQQQLMPPEQRPDPCKITSGYRKKQQIVET